MGGTLKDCLLITMTELLCSWEERRVAVEDSFEKGAAFQVQSAYESLCWRGCYCTQYPNASQPYVSRPIDTISIPSRSWSYSTATHLFLHLFLLHLLGSYVHSVLIRLNEQHLHKSTYKLIFI